MNDIFSAKQNDIICYCSGTTKQQILTLIDKGVHTLDELSRKTGASAGCGGCETWITDILKAAVKQTPSP